jgi:hypothetical protein
MGVAGSVRIGLERLGSRSQPGLYHSRILDDNADIAPVHPEMIAPGMTTDPTSEERGVPSFVWGGQASSTPAPAIILSNTSRR